MPIRRIGRSTPTFNQCQRSAAVARRNDDLREWAWLEPAGTHSPAILGKFRRQKLAATEVLKPIVPGNQVNLSVAIDIERIDAFSVLQCGAFTGGPGKYFGRWPRIRVVRVGRNVRQEQFFRALVPKRQLWPAGPLEITEDLVVMLGGAAALDHAALP